MFGLNLFLLRERTRKRTKLEAGRSPQARSLLRFETL
jgi:hypothetical protein